MLRSVIAGSSIIALLLIHDVSNAQVRNIAPYVGASGSLGHGIGWGIEGGARFFSFYAGLEDGIYYNPPIFVTQSYGPGPYTYAKYVGIHAGIMTDSLSIGIVVLQGHQVWCSFDSTHTFWDFGLDVKHRLTDSHIYIAFALTYQRGLKLGLGYMF